MSNATRRIDHGHRGFLSAVQQSLKDRGSRFFKGSVSFYVSRFLFCIHTQTKIGGPTKNKCFLGILTALEIKFGRFWLSIQMRLFATIFKVNCDVRKILYFVCFVKEQASYFDAAEDFLNTFLDTFQ